jgi:hypothetical protein
MFIRPMNSLKIQWNHLVYKDTFYCSDIIKKLYHRQPHGLDVKGIGRLHSFLGLQGITYRNRPFWEFESPCVTWSHFTRVRVRVKVSIILFTICHMATQQLLEIITNAIIGPWHATFVINSSMVKVCHYSYMCN